MAVIEKTTFVDAPVDTVFDYLDDPMHVSEVAPGVDRVEVERRTDERIGDSFRLIGSDFLMTLVVTGYERPHTLESDMQGPMSGKCRWYVREIKRDKSELGIRIEYELERGAAGRGEDSVTLERTNEENTERMLENVKRRAERIAATGR